MVAVVLIFPALCVIGAAQEARPSGPFAAYTSCRLPNGLAVVETAPLAPGVSTRTVDTVTGHFSVKMLEGRRIMFAYPDEDFYANVKVEILPAEGYAESREALISNFNHILADDDGSSRNYKLKPTMNGFAIQGLDRLKREGGVLGIYLLFDDATRTVITMYLLNQEPPKRFKTMEEYGVVRDQFLANYTGCVRVNLGRGL